MASDRFPVTLRPSGLRFYARPEQDLLSAAAQAGIAVPAACRNGVCELCEAWLLNGTARNTRNQQNIAPAGSLVLCRTLALGPVELEIKQVMAAGTHPAKKMRAEVVEVKPLSHDVFRVELKLPRRRELSFHAGQYLAVELTGTEPCYFSIASAPDAANLELHIQAAPEWILAGRVIDALTVGASVTLSVPQGSACLAVLPDKPLVLVVAGTGFAQAKSMIDYLRAHESGQPVTLYWGVRCQQDMYLRAMGQQWHESWAPFTFVPVVGDSADNDWNGHHGQLVHSVLASAVDWANVRVMASGSPAMVHTLMDNLLAAGLPASEFFSDVLEYAPRG